ncbi:CRISPR system precrRNA processing endoribonuclease RAMP protein Cas6 [Marinifilum sp. JC120]|nr:CRISPR system precrRNA processing endoribonuclease RAMP protein Cas6 [Marinifilum sp. JC120]
MKLDSNAMHIESYSPVLGTEMRRFRLHFKSPAGWPFSVREADGNYSLLVSRVRSRLGLLLKKRSCYAFGYADFRNRVCADCPEGTGCLYPRFFMPTFEIRGKVNDISPPFVFQLAENGPEQKGKQPCRLDLNIFGNGVELVRFIVPALCEVLDELYFPEVGSAWWKQNGLEPRLPFEFAGVEIIRPSGECAPLDYEAGASIEVYTAGGLVGMEPDGKYDIEIRFNTPLQIRGGDSSSSTTFHELVSRSVNRLRSINRWYHTGSMGRFSSEFWKMAENIRSAPKLHSVQAGRYSERQGVGIDLSGMAGLVRCYGVPGEYLPILYGGSLIHIGSKTSHGLGNFSVHCLK